MTKTLFAEFTVTPGNEGRVRELMLDFVDRVRQEPGNLSFVPYTLHEEPRRYFVFEVYTDESAFTAHIDADYGAQFNAELATLIEGSGSQLTWLMRVEAQA